MREIQIIIAIVNNHNKIANPVDKAMQFQQTFKMDKAPNRNNSRIKTAVVERNRLIQDPEDRIKDQAI